MSSQEKRTFSLPTALSKYIDELVESGVYASGSEVVRAGLRSLLERHEAVERWHEDMAVTHHTLHAEPGRVTHAKEQAQQEESHLDEWKKTA